MLEIPESLLEAHYLHPIRLLFEKVFGAKCINVYKPTPQKEAWVGFDQAWVKSDLSWTELCHSLEARVMDGLNQIDRFYFGLFLQFKVVKKITRRSKYLPIDYVPPYYRAELSLSPNKVTTMSQHETLVKLNDVMNANVAYACPMIFDHDDLHNPTLDNLMIVDITTAPQGWLTNQSHFITFQDIDGSNTKWCSIPTEGKSISFKEWIKIILKPMPMRGIEIIELIKKTEEYLLPKGPEHNRLLWLSENEGKATSLLPECFSVFEFKNKTNKTSTYFKTIDLD